MGVLGPLEEAIIGDGVPATPPDLQDLQADNSGDDLFTENSEAKTNQKNGVFSFENLIMIPLMPSKVEYEDLLGLEVKVQSPQQQRKKKNFCSRCFEEVKKDFKKLAKVVENFKNERDAARAENESLKKEVEELKRILKAKEEKEKNDVRVIIDNKNSESVDVSVRRKNFQNARSVFNKPATCKDSFDSSNQFGISSFSISLQDNQTFPTGLNADVQPRSKKTIAELRREFFAQEFQSEQNSFTARNYLEVKPEKKEELERSRLTVRVKPKQKINEIVSKLTSKFGNSQVMPEASPITLFQRFEKTKNVWKNGLEGLCA